MDSASPAGSPESWMIMLPNRRRSSGRSSWNMGSRAGKGSIQVVLVAANPGRAVWSPNASRPVTAVMAAPKHSQTICDRRIGADLGDEPFRATPNSARSRIGNISGPPPAESSTRSQIGRFSAAAAGRRQFGAWRRFHVADSRSEEFTAVNLCLVGGGRDGVPIASGRRLGSSINKKTGASLRSAPATRSLPTADSPLPEA